MDPVTAISIFGKAKELIGGLGVNEVEKARLDLAFDHAEMLEKKVAVLERERADVSAELRAARAELQEASGHLAKLREEHAEEVRVVEAVEFRRGKRTGGKWQAFCPKCHLPAHLSEDSGDYLSCSDRDCRWTPPVGTAMANQIAASLPK